MTRHDFVLCLVWSEHSGNNIFVVKNRPESQKGRINIPGGKVEANDGSPSAAARRELREETGIDCEPDFLGVITGAWSEEDTYFIHCFRFDLKADREIHPREGEDEEFFWAHWDQVRTDPRILPNLNFIVPLMNGAVGGWTIIDDNPGFDVRPYRVELSYDDRV